ncbi:MAG: type I pantothenate kinase [Buchnera aphidicola (Floraphis choui)]
MKILNSYLHFKYIIRHLVTDILYNDIIYRKNFEHNNKTPYIIGISGSVAVGKSTISKWFKDVLKTFFVTKNISIITTDNFLYSNKILYELGLIEKKGFPQTYNMKQLIKFFLDIRLGVNNIAIPVYSHFFYDIIPNFKKIVYKSDIFIVEGLHILNPLLYRIKKNNRYISLNFLNFSIYIDADYLFLKEWYLTRFLKLRYISKFYSNSFLNYYSKMSCKDAMNMATKIWYNTNYRNLKENILPTRKYADYIITKNYNHEINNIQYMNKNNI